MRTVLYFRVSTASQGRSGLGLEAQRATVAAFCDTRSCEVLGEYIEVESGKRDDRPELKKVLDHARLTGSTVVIAKLDRLSRNAAFLLTLRDSGVKFVAADMPDACHLTVGILAMVAQQEREAISKRTKEALAAAKARGTWTKADGTPYRAGKRLGNPNGAEALRRAAKGNGAAVEALKGAADRGAADLAPVIASLKAEGKSSLRELANALNERRYETPRGGVWHPTSVKNLLARIEAL
jgi:DNA invertase Pin-like site-specific DNA recombinase